MDEEQPHGLRRELAHNLQIGIGTGLIGGGLLGLLAAAASLALNSGILRSFGGVVRLVVGLQLVYGVLCLVLGMAGAAFKTLFFLVTRRSLSDTKTAGFAAWLVFFLIGGLYAFSWARWQGIGGLALSAPFRWSNVPVLLGIAAISALLARLLGQAFYLLIVFVKKPERRRPDDLRHAFRILLYGAVAFTVFLVVARVTAGRRPERSGLTRDMVQAPPTGGTAGRPVAILAIDGMAPQDVAWLRAEGRLRWADRLLGGTRGSVRAPVDPLPPIDWTVVATGRDLSAHGITDYQARVVRGLPIPVTIGPEQLGLFELAHSVLPFLHMTRDVPVRSYMRETKGLWNMASDAGRRCVVVNWWVSWPAERVRGAVVSDHAWVKLAGAPPTPDRADDPEERARVTARVAASVQTPGPGIEGAISPVRPDGKPLLLESETWPGTLLVELSVFAGPSLPESLAARYGPVPPAEALTALTELGIPGDALRSDCFHAQAAAWLLDREQPDLWMLHLPGPDVIRRVLAHRIAAPAERERRRRDALRVYFDALEVPLGAVATVAPAAAVVARTAKPPQLLLWVTLPGLPWKDEASRPEGFLALAGDGMRPGPLAAPIAPDEIAPTVLWMLGLPSARDMDGGPRTDLLTPDAAAALPPVRWIASYGRQETEGIERAASSIDQEMLERFRSLGYIQ
jgi:hypothetical protein